MTASCSLIAGRLLWKWARYPVELEKAAGHDVRLVESPGWIERRFTAYGPSDAIERINRAWQQRGA